MNNTFNIKRFNQVLAYDWKRFIRNFGITLLVWISIPVMFWVTSLVFGFEIDPGVRVFVIFVLIAITIMSAPSRIYGKVNLPREGVGFAMLPVTILEKFFSMFLYCSLLTPFLTIVGAWLVDCLMTLLPFGGFKEFIPLKDVLTGGSFGDLLMLIVALITTAWAESSIFMFGNMFFKRRKAGKTFGWGLLIIFAITMTLQLFDFWDAFGMWITNTSFRMGERFLPWLYSAVLLVIAVVFYFLTYRKIKTQKY